MRSDGPDWTAVRASSSWNGLDDQVQGMLRMHGEVPIGFGNIFESSQAAYVRDVQIAQTGQVLRLVSDLSTAAVFVMGEIAYEMQTRFNLPMSAHQLQQRL